MLARIRSVWDALLRRSGLESRMDAEIQAHLEELTEDLVRSGMPREQAARRARIEFGGLDAVKEECREARGLRWTDELRQNVRYALRSLRKARGFTAAAVASLALGIGVNTAIFSVVSAALLRPLPYADPGRLVAVFESRAPGGGRLGAMANANYADLRANSPALADLAAHVSTGSTVTGAGEAEQLAGRLVTGNLFAMLGVTAQLGRVLLPEDAQPGRPGVMLLSYELWQRRFGGDPNIVGRTVAAEGKPQTIVGVMPEGFRFPGARDEFWQPLQLNPKDLQQRSNHNLRAIGRLRPGATLRQAQGEASVIARRLEREYASTNAGIDFYLAPLHESLTRNVRSGLTALMSAVALLLLIAAVNAGNLILTRSTARRRELAIRTALGADRGRLIRQLLTETLCLSTLGGGAALVFCFVIVNGLRKSLPPALVPAGAIQVDGAVLGFGLLISMAAGALCGLAPAWLASRADPHEGLSGGSRSSTGSGTEIRTRRVLVGFEVALTVVLLIGAGLLLRSFAKLMTVDPGFQPGNALAVRFALPQFVYPTHPQRLAFYERLLERMRALPGVESAALTTCSPLTPEGGSSWFVREGRPAAHPQDLIANNRLVSAEYFRTMRIPVREGRVFSTRDGADAPLVAVINESMARRFWPGESPVGKRFQFISKPWVEIVGVVGDVRQDGLDTASTPEIYRPYAQDGQVWLAPRALVFRTSADPAAVAPAVREQFRTLDRNAPIYGMDAMDALLEKTVAARRLQMTLVAAFGLVALVLASVGVYGVVAYLAAQRRQEIAIRIALGAGRGAVVRMMLGKALAPVLCGLAVGLAAAAALRNVLATQLYRVSGTDAATFATVPVVIVTVAVIAAYAPSRRAARLDPAAAVRSE